MNLGRWVLLAAIGLFAVIRAETQALPDPTPRLSTPREDWGRGTRSTRHYQFVLTKGRGEPVCEADVQRLNRTEFEVWPTCDIPDTVDAPGFERLGHVWASVAAQNRVFYRVESLLRGEPVEPPERPVKQRDGSIVVVRRDEDPVRKDTFSYFFDPPVDIDNDGIPDNVLIWDDRWRGLGRCDTFGGGDPQYIREWQFPFILTADGADVDERRTQAVFGTPHSVPTQPESAFPRYYYPYGAYYGIFKYRGSYYFHAALQLSAPLRASSHKPPSLRSMQRIGVFIHEHAQTRQVCELHFAE
jgi:hypothetical protein